jgi:eukaryotic-like serine/threonine-protein kinase
VVGKVAGHYRLLEKLGEGGMGEVYRARDTRLNRFVAVKALPADKLQDSGWRARFIQEARAASSLNHPNIVTVYDIVTEDESDFIVMEYIKGETLAEKIAHKQLRPQQTLRYAAEIAEALARAHSAGIVHRDLKPSNIMIGDDGAVKVLDFGVAKRTALASGVEDDTATMPRTGQGVVVGTTCYMSPEQVRGQEVDHRADIFSFGLVLHEALSGRRAFEGESAIDVMNAILREEPPGLPDTVPPAVRQIVASCLEKDPAARFESARDLALALRALSAGTSTEAVAQHAATPRRSRLREGYLLGLGLLTGILAGMLLLVWMLRPQAGNTPVLRHLTYSGHDASPALSPDGRTVAFSSDRDGQKRIWLKQLEGGAEAPLTDGPDDFPRFSPDGVTLLFIREEDDRPSVFKTTLLAGAPRRSVDDAVYADWSPDGRSIAFIRLTRGTESATVLGVADTDGGNVRVIARFPNEWLAHPRWSPDGKTIALVPSLMTAGVPAFIVLAPVAGGNVRRVAIPKQGFGISAVAWAGSGNELVYLLAETATGFLGSAGSTAYVVRHEIGSDVARRLFWSPYGAQVVEIAGPGRLIFDTSSPRVGLREYALRGRDFVPARWLTRGNGHDRQPCYAPDGEQVLFSSGRDRRLGLWQLSTRTGAVHRFTEGPPGDWDPAFSDGGESVLWSSNRTGHFEIWMARADGGGARQLTYDGVDAENPTATPDGEWIVYASTNAQKQGLWKIRRDGSQATRLVAGAAQLPEVSPDGRYAAFTIDTLPTSVTLRVARIEDGAPVPFEVLIPIRNANLSGSIGRSRWLPDGRSIAFLGQDQRGVNGIFVQEFVPGKDTSSTRRALAGFDEEAVAESFGISPDGKRMVVASWEQTFSLSIVEGVRDIQPTQRPARR